MTDTHCIRLSNRIGLVDDLKDPGKVEKALWKIVPPQEGSELCHRLVYHAERSAPPAPSPTVTAAVWRISAASRKKCEKILKRILKYREKETERFFSLYFLV